LKIQRKSALLGLAILAGYAGLNYLLLPQTVPGWYTMLFLFPFALAMAVGYGSGELAFWCVLMAEAVMIWLVIYLLLCRRYRR
jgi:hypothetical protein